PGTSGTLVLAEAAGGWSATLGGKPLTPLAAPVDGWAQGFTLPAGGGHLVITRNETARNLSLPPPAPAPLPASLPALPPPRAPPPPRGPGARRPRPPKVPGASGGRSSGWPARPRAVVLAPRTATTPRPATRWPPGRQRPTRSVLMVTPGTARTTLRPATLRPARPSPRWASRRAWTTRSPRPGPGSRRRSRRPP